MKGVKGFKSLKFVVNYGVPQGIVFGPILFILYLVIPLNPVKLNVCRGNIGLYSW